MEDTNNGDNDSQEIRPTLRLSRFKTSRKSVAPNPQPRKRRRKKNKLDDIPIPSFSPLSKNLQEIDTSCLDSPPVVKKEALKKEMEPSVFHDDDSDDDDDALLNGPPIFSSSVSKATTVKKKNTKRRKIDKAEKKQTACTENDDGQALSNDTNDATSKLAVVTTLPNDIMQTIESVVNSTTFQNQTANDLANVVMDQHGITSGNKQLRRMIRDEVKARVQQRINKEEEQRATSSTAEHQNSNSDKENNNNTTTVVKPDEDELIMSVHHLFAQPGAQEASVEEFYVNLEAQFGAQLHSESQALVKEHVEGLRNGTIESTVSPVKLPSPSRGNEALSVNLDVSKDNNDDDDGDDGITMLMDDNNDDSVEQPIEATKTRPKKPVAPSETTQAKPRKRGRPRKTAKPASEDDDSISNVNHAAARNKDALEEEQPPVERPAPTRKRAPPKKPRAPRAKKGTCSLCSTCTCRIPKDTNVKDTPAVMSRTDAEIERALLRRSKKLEGIIDKYQGLLDNVNRDLKKHRRAVWKKEEEQINDGRQLAFGDSRFLPDAHDWDEQADAAIHAEALSPTVVQEATEAVFGSGNCQITLTQMFGGGGSKETEKTPALDQNEANTTEAAANAKNAASSQTVAEDTNDIASDAEESLQECGEMDAEEEEPPVDNIHRLAWRNGAKIETQSPLLRGSGAWSALTTNKPTTKSSPVLAETSLSVTSPARETEGYKPRPPTRNGNYNCAWDALFSDSMDDDDETRMDQLLGLFETEMQDDCSSDSQMCSQQSAFETLPLTQRGESIAETIEEEITSDPVRLHSIEAVCPNWRANIRFALSHRGSDDVGLALERVRRSIVNLQNTKEKVSTVWKRQEVVLELFEAALSASLARLTNGAQNDE